MAREQASRLGRRGLLAGGLGAVSTLLLKDAAAGPPSAKKTAADRVTLGKTGIVTSRLAVGSGTNGWGGTSIQTRLGYRAFGAILKRGLDQGVNFWETADQYGAHDHFRRAIAEVGRKKVVVLTKTRARTGDELEADLSRFLKELGTDHIDIVLLHNMQSSTWTREREGAMERLERAKEKGVIRAHGVSCHTLSALEVAAKTAWVEVDLARVNPAGLHMDAEPETVLEVLGRMKRAGKGVIGMKILGQGELEGRLERAISYATRLHELDAFTIGFKSRGELDEVTRKIAAA